VAARKITGVRKITGSAVIPGVGVTVLRPLGVGLTPGRHILACLLPKLATGCG
jgi:hypothetical protein